MLDRADVLQKVQSYVAGVDLAIELLEDLQTAGVLWPGKVRALRAAREKVCKLRDTIAQRTISFRELEKLATDMTNHELEWFDQKDFEENLQFARNLKAQMTEISRLLEVPEKFFTRVTDEQLQELFAE